MLEEQFQSRTICLIAKRTKRFGEHLRGRGSVAAELARD
jgi:hypothetical protein